jgi:hypothetical protein
LGGADLVGWARDHFGGGFRIENDAHAAILGEWRHRCPRSRPTKMIDANAIRAGLKHSVTRPFRVVPFFDAGVRGGQWMKEACDLPRDVINYACCFDCAPEENSLLLQFGATTIELPSIDLVHQHPSELLGPSITSRFALSSRFDSTFSIHSTAAI